MASAIVGSMKITRYDLAAKLQHAMQCPSGHLDRWAQFGPAFEEPIDQTDARDVHAADDRQTTTPYGVHATIRTIAETNTKLQAIDESVTIGAKLEAISQIRQFITGGKAIFTIAGVNQRYTWKVTKSTDSDKPECYFVSLLTGPDNLQDYTYAGLLDVSTGALRLTKASKMTAESTPVKAWNWTITRVWKGQEITPATFYHLGRCGRCGRALTVPSSIESGFGPECAGKLE